MKKSVKLLEKINDECLNKITELASGITIKDGKVYLKPPPSPYDIIAGQHNLFEQGIIGGLQLAMGIICSEITLLKKPTSSE